MHVSVEKTSTLERNLTITVPAEFIEEKLIKRLQKTAKKIKLDGFRPGKVPLSVVKKRFGTPIREEIMEEVIQDTFYQAIEQESLKPAGQPNIQPISYDENKDFEYIAKFEVYPEIVLAEGDLNLHVEKVTAQITDTDIETMLVKLREQHKTWHEVVRPAASGDQVTVDFIGRLDNIPFEGGQSNGHVIELGSKSMIPGFEEGIEGMSTGETKTIEVTFPEHYHADHLKGKNALFDITLQKVSEAQLPELNDDFFKKFEIAEGGLEAFKADIRKNMERELSQTLKAQEKTQIFDALLSAHSFEIPSALVDQEIQQLRNQAVQQFSHTKNAPSATDLPDDLFREQAKKRVSLGLLIGKVIDGNKISVSDEALKAKITEIAAPYQDPEQVINWYLGNEKAREQVKSIALEDEVVQWLYASAIISEKPLSYDKVMQPESTSDS